jgi:outer membrane protein TolC
MPKIFRILLLLAAALGTACATGEPRWTPETVAPPAWVAEAPAPVEAAPAEATPAPTLEPELPAVPLAIQEAVLLAFGNNRSIDVAELDPEIAATAIDEARAAWDPAVAGSLRTGRNVNKIETTTSSTGNTSESGDSLADLSQSIASIISAVNTPTITSDVRDTTSLLAVTQRLPTGTQLTVTGDYAGTRSNLNGKSYDGGWTAELTQPLLRGAGTGVNFIALRQARNNEAISQHGFRQRVIDITEQVEVTYWDLVLARAVLEINTFAVTLAEEQLILNRDFEQAGRGVEADVLSAKAESASRQADVIDAKARIRDRNLALIRLLNPENPDPWRISFNPETPVLTPEPTVQAEESVALAMDYRPELAQSRLDVANSDLGVKGAKNELLPNLDLVASVGESNRADSRSGALDFLSGNSGENYAVGIEFDTAILRRAEKARYRRSRLEQTQSERLLSDTEQAIETETRQAVVEVERQWARIAPSTEAVLARTAELDTAQARYATGRSTNLDVLIVQRDLIQARINEVTARTGYLQALASLYAAEGTLLERRGIVLAEAE